MHASRSPRRIFSRSNGSRRPPAHPPIFHLLVGREPPPAPETFAPPPDRLVLTHRPRGEHPILQETAIRTLHSLPGRAVAPDRRGVWECGSPKLRPPPYSHT